MAEFAHSLNVICLESEAFYRLVDEVVERLKQDHAPNGNPWLTDSEAMQLLGITSKTTLQKYRDEGRIRFSQPSRKIILYDRVSILQFLDDHAKNPF